MTLGLVVQDDPGFQYIHTMDAASVSRTPHTRVHCHCCHVPPRRFRSSDFASIRIRCYRENISDGEYIIFTFSLALNLSQAGEFSRRSIYTLGQRFIRAPTVPEHQEVHAQDNSLPYSPYTRFRPREGPREESATPVGSQASFADFHAITVSYPITQVTDPSHVPETAPLAYVSPPPNSPPSSSPGPIRSRPREPRPLRIVRQLGTQSAAVVPPTPHQASQQSSPMDEDSSPTRHPVPENLTHPTGPVSSASGTEADPMHISPVLPPLPALLEDPPSTPLLVLGSASSAGGTSLETNPMHTDPPSPQGLSLPAVGVTTSTPLAPRSLQTGPSSIYPDRSSAQGPFTDRTARPTRPLPLPAALGAVLDREIAERLNAATVGLVEPTVRGIVDACIPRLTEFIESQFTTFALKNSAGSHKASQPESDSDEVDQVVRSRKKPGPRGKLNRLHVSRLSISKFQEAGTHNYIRRKHSVITFGGRWSFHLDAPVVFLQQL